MRIGFELWEEAFTGFREMGPLSERIARMDLTYLEGQHRLWRDTAGREGARFPGRVALARRWDWTPSRARDFVARDDWHDTENPIPLSELRHSRWGTEPDNDGDAPDALFELPGPLTHADVVQRAVRWLRGHHECKAVFAEISTYERVNPDAIGFRKSAGAVSSWSVLVEAKISRSDFRADREKVIHRLPDSCPGQERWYLTPPNMVRPEEVPAGWGLAECGKRSVRIVKLAPIGEFSVGRAHADMGILLSAVRRHECGANWFDETARFAPYSATRTEAK